MPHVHVNNLTSLPLPDGAATETKLEAVRSLLAGTLAVRPARNTNTVTNGALSASGDSAALIAAPGAGQRIVISYIKIQSHSSTAVTVLLKAGATVIDDVRCAADGDGLALVFGVGNELALAENTDFRLNLSVSASVRYTVHHRVEAV